MEPVEITAGRLHLRPWRDGDAPCLRSLLDDATVARWTPHRSPYRLQDAAARLAGDRAHWAAGTRAELAVVEATTGALVGTAGLYHLRGDQAEVGWVTAPQSRGGGVATQAVQSLCRWAFGGLGLRRLEARVAVGNWASRRVAEKAGFHVEGTVRDGSGAGTWVHARLRDDDDTDTAAFPAYPPVSDGVVTLRRWQVSDAQDVARACDDPETARWLPVPAPYTQQDGLGYVDGIVPTQWFDGQAANVAVTDTAGGALLGAVGLSLRSGIGEVGYWTAPWARGKGVAVRACRLHTHWGLERLALPRVELLTDVDNLASQRVAQKAGYVREGIARSVRPAARGHGRADMFVWSMLPADAGPAAS